MDSDDYLTPDFLQLLSISDADLVCSSFDTFGASSNSRIFNGRYDGDEEIGKCLEQHICDEILRVPWAKRFSRELIEQFEIRFDERLRLGEDTVFVQTYLQHSSSIEILSPIGYHFRCSNVSKYRLSDEQFLIFSALLADSYHQLSSRYGFRSKAYEYHYLCLFPLFVYYAYQCETRAFRLGGYGLFCTAMQFHQIVPCDELSSERTLFGVVARMMTRRKQLIPFLLMRFVRPLLHWGKVKTISV